MTYRVEVQRTFCTSVDVEADTENEAVVIAKFYASMLEHDDFTEDASLEDDVIVYAMNDDGEPIEPEVWHS